MINQVTLVGRLTKDPDLRLTPEGTPVVNLTLAVNRPFKNHNGDYETDFVHCTIWRKAAENTANYCRKGMIIGITGKIHTRNYQNQEGKKVYVTEVVAEAVQFLSKKSPEEQRTVNEQRPAVEHRTSVVQSSPISNDRGTGREEWAPSNHSNTSNEWMSAGQNVKEAAVNAPAAAGGVS